MHAYLDGPLRQRRRPGDGRRGAALGGVLARLEKDPADCARELDWVAKLRLLEGFRQRENLPWDAARLQLIDLQWSDVRPEKGLYHRLWRAARWSGW